VVTLKVFLGALAKKLSLLEVGMLGCMSMSASLPYQMALWGLSSGCLSPGFLSGVGPLVGWFSEVVL
jgi:hypothetical protein